MELKTNTDRFTVSLQNLVS